MRWGFWDCGRGWVSHGTSCNGPPAVDTRYCSASLKLVDQSLGERAAVVI